MVHPVAHGDEAGFGEHQLAGIAERAGVAGAGLAIGAVGVDRLGLAAAVGERDDAAALVGEDVELVGESDRAAGIDRLRRAERARLVDIALGDRAARSAGERHRDAAALPHIAPVVGGARRVDQIEPAERIIGIVGGGPVDIGGQQPAELVVGEAVAVITGQVAAAVIDRGYAARARRVDVRVLVEPVGRVAGGAVLDKAGRDA